MIRFCEMTEGEFNQFLEGLRSDKNEAMKYWGLVDVEADYFHTGCDLYGWSEVENHPLTDKEKRTMLECDRAMDVIQVVRTHARRAETVPTETVPTETGIDDSDIPL